MKTVATHNNGFHADDVFAVATLELVFGELQIVRTRDKDLINGADIVVDVGLIHDEEKMRFDHHQEGGAGSRENSVPYASFGLVWKSFGERVCGSKELAEIVDKGIVCAIDAIDNGFSLMIPKFEYLSDYSISSVIGSMNPTFLEKDISPDSIFPKAVSLAKEIILREIASAKASSSARELFRKAVIESPDKRYVILEEEYSRQIFQKFTDEFPELLFVVIPRGEDFAIRSIRKNPASFENRKDLPLSWAGKSGEELEKITGIEGANFCHNKRFVANAKTKDAVLKMLEIALKE